MIEAEELRQYLAAIDQEVGVVALSADDTGYSDRSQDFRPRSSLLLNSDNLLELCLGKAYIERH